MKSRISFMLIPIMLVYSNLAMAAEEVVSKIEFTPIAEILNKIISGVHSGEGLDTKLLLSVVCFLAVGYLKKGNKVLKRGRTYSLVFIISAVGNYLFTGDPLLTSQFLTEVAGIALGAVGLHQGSKLLKGSKK